LAVSAPVGATVISSGSLMERMLPDQRIPDLGRAFRPGLSLSG
jgi:hypothetical protein